uniref:Uncharacterized protein n=1 Tax=Manihot esculenta TaxID=3983 RepID=A0A2C9VU70_MANES
MMMCVNLGLKQMIFYYGNWEELVLYDRLEQVQCRSHYGLMQMKMTTINCILMDRT